MWIIARGGFYSIVEKPWDKALGTVTVRARRREDLETLRDYTDVTIKETPAGDYPFRCTLKKDTMAAIVARMILDIDYRNFKDTQDNLRHNVYLTVWSNLRRLEPFFRPWGTAIPLPTPQGELPLGYPLPDGKIIWKQKKGKKRAKDHVR